MYPYFRALKHLTLAKFAGPKRINEKGVLKMRVWFSDIDIYPELNNGRHLTIMDLGRYEFGMRMGLLKVLKKKSWGLMVAGNFTRYRRRLMFLQSYCLETELVAYDERWFYFYQQTKRKGKVHSSALVRTAVTSQGGLIPCQDVANELNIPFNPSVPPWIEQWIDLHELSPSL